MKQTFMNISSKKRQFIIDTTIDIFSKNGYELTSTNQIVKTLNISKGSLFQYFDTKLDLYMYLVIYTINQLEKYLNHFTIQSTNIRDSLLEFATHEYDYLCENPTLYRFFYRLINDLKHPDLVNVYVELIENSTRYQREVMQKLMPTYIKNNIQKQNDYFFLMHHIFYIIKGYNETFMQSISDREEYIKLRDTYINGLNNHFDLVRWNNE